MDRVSIHRRRLLTVGAAAAVAAAAGTTLAGCSRGKPAQIVASTFGGMWGDSIKKNIDAEFTRQFGIDVVPDAGADNSARVAKVRLGLGNSVYDVLHLADSFFSRAEQEGVLEPIDYDSANLFNTMHMASAFRHRDWAASMFTSYGLAYNPSLVKTPPRSWQDLWAPEYRGKVVFPSISHSFGLFVFIIGALAAGRNPKDTQAGTAMLEKFLAQRPVWGADTPTMLQSMETRQCALGAMLRSDVLTAQDEGYDIQFVVPDEGAFLVSWGFGVVKNSKKVPWAERYVNLTLDPGIQAKMADRWKISATNDKWSNFASPELVKRLETPLSMRRKLIELDYAWLDQRRSVLTEAWNKTVS
jgi:putative spermidine/putrescine transport system substrate-binding protein